MDWLTKPFSTELLRAKIASLILLNRSNREALMGRVRDALVDTAGAPRRRPDPRALCARAGLTERETEVALLIATGAADKDIATRLSVSVRTVNNHVARILRGFGLQSRAEVLKLLIERE